MSWFSEGANKVFGGTTTALLGGPITAGIALAKGAYDRISDLNSSGSGGGDISSGGVEGFADENMAFMRDLAEKQIALNERQVAIAEEQQAMSKDRYAYWKSQYMPLEMQLVGQVGQGIDPNYASARAGADVTATFDKAQQAQARNMERRGIDASSPAYAQQQAQLAIARAAAEAGARNQARNVTNDTNFSRRYSVAGLGRDLPQQAASMSGLAANTYGAAAGTLRGAAQTYNTGFQGQMQAAQMGIGVDQFNANREYQQDALRAQRQGQMWNAVGSLVGTGLGAYAGGGFGAAAGGQAGSRMGTYFGEDAR